MSTAEARTAHAKTILGAELHARLSDTTVLLVGAGGIGCELCMMVILLFDGFLTTDTCRL
jgi:ubiquitin-like 1-activating enzyme E1 B